MGERGEKEKRSGRNGLNQGKKEERKIRRGLLTGISVIDDEIKRFGGQGHFFQESERIMVKKNATKTEKKSSIGSKRRKPPQDTAPKGFFHCVSKSHRRGGRGLISQHTETKKILGKCVFEVLGSWSLSCLQGVPHNMPRRNFRETVSIPLPMAVIQG